MRKPISPLPTIGYLWSVLGTVTGSLLLSPLRNLVELSNIALLYVLSIVVVAVTYGRGPAVLGALLSSLCYAYFFVPPHFSLAITEGQNLLAAVIMLIVALLVSHLASRLKQHADYAHQKSVESTNLYELSQALAGAMTPASVITLASQFLPNRFRPAKSECSCRTNSTPQPTRSIRPCWRSASNVGSSSHAPWVRAVFTP